MIRTETVEFEGTEYIRTYSDMGMMIEREGVRYCEAIDPMGSDRVYTETDEVIEEDEEGEIEEDETDFTETGEVT